MTGKKGISDDGPKGKETLKELRKCVEQSLQCVRNRPLVITSESSNNLLKYLAVV